MKKRETDILWHYTSVQNAISILTSGELWATQCDFLNDSQDIRTPLRHFLNYVRDKKYEAAFKENDLDVLEYAASGDYIGAFYVLSFSACEDSLPMWTTYTPHGGCAIGFDKMALWDFYNSHDADAKERNYYPLLNGLYRIDYTEMKGSEAFKEIEQDVDKFYKKYNSENGGERKIGKTYATLSFCVARKDSSFSFEQEYRFVFLVKLNQLAESVFFNAGKPFVKIKLPKISKCVSQVMLSPHGVHNLTEHSLDFVKKVLSFKEKADVDFQITKSRHQFRIPQVITSAK